MENKVANKAIETIDLLKLIDLNSIKGFDVKPFLFQGIILKESEFREQLKTFDFSNLQNAKVYIYCSTQAIIPMWAFMLLSSYLTDAQIPHLFAKDYEEAINLFIAKEIDKLDENIYRNKRVIIKGCSGKFSVKENAYVKITQKLKPVVKAISYGEACSMVPVAKN
jgi:hypothetical protein